MFFELFIYLFFYFFYITIIYIVHTCINNLQMNITKNSRLFCTTVWQKSFNIYLLVSNIKLRIHTYVFELITNYDIRCVLCSFLRFYIKNYHKVLCNTVIAQWRYYNIIIIAHNSFVSNMFICVWISYRYYFIFKGTKKKMSKLIYMTLANDISTSMVFSFKSTCLVLNESFNTITLYSEFLTTNVQS